MFSIGWDEMFTLGVPILEKIIRPIIVYIFLIIGLRLAGKRGLASLNSFDLVVLLCISNTVQNAIIGNDNSVSGGVIGAATLLFVNYVVVRFFFEHPKLDEIVEGEVTVLIEDGKVLEKNLHRELITMGELTAAAHKQGIRSLEQVERAELEPGGALAFFAKEPTPDEKRESEIIQKLDALTQQLSEMRAKMDAKQG
jgi:uncharacterized membrane protein YcaP (DUF421 family)